MLFRSTGLGSTASNSVSEPWRERTPTGSPVIATSRSGDFKEEKADSIRAAAYPSNSGRW